MDPLSISCSVVTLIQAASAVASSLYTLIDSLRTADARVAALSDDIRRLTGFLAAVENALQSCQPKDQAMLDAELWQQSELVLMDCKMTLHELEVLIGRIREESGVDTRDKHTWGWRARTRVQTVLNLNIHGPAMDVFRDKIQKSNQALQTILHTITLSVSLRTNDSQRVISLELGQLKDSIDKVLLQASSCWVYNRGGIHGVGGRSGDQSAARMARNLERLAEAAQHFHCAASTAATVRGTISTVSGGIAASRRTSTVLGAGVNDHMGSHAGTWAMHPALDSAAAMSIMGGGLTPAQRERIEQFIGQQQPYTDATAAAAASAAPAAPAVPLRGSVWKDAEPEQDTGNILAPEQYMPAMEEKEEDGDIEDEVEFKVQVLDTLEEMASEHMEEGCYSRAVDCIKEALQKENTISSADGEPCLDGIFHRLRVMLALCYLLGRKWKLAEPIVLGLAASAKRARVSASGLGPAMQKNLVVVANLLHALALGHLSAFSFDEALARCVQALQMKKKVLNSQCHADNGSENTTDYCTTLGLLVTIYGMKGDCLRAEIFNRQIKMKQASFTYSHPSSEADFLFQHPVVLPASLRAKSGSPDKPADTHGAANDIKAFLEAHRLYNPLLSKDDDTMQSPLQHTSSAGNSMIKSTSSLRARQDEWERYERDTWKEVVTVEDSNDQSDCQSVCQGVRIAASEVGASIPDSAICLDADEEETRDRKHRASGSLRRHLTHLFSRSDRQLSSGSPTTAATVIHKAHLFPKGYGSLFRKPRTLLQRHSLTQGLDDETNHEDSYVQQWLRDVPESAQSHDILRSTSCPIHINWSAGSRDELPDNAVFEMPAGRTSIPSPVAEPPPIRPYSHLPFHNTQLDMIENPGIGHQRQTSTRRLSGIPEEHAASHEPEECTGDWQRRPLWRVTSGRQLQGGPHHPAENNEEPVAPVVTEMEQNTGDCDAVACHSSRQEVEQPSSATDQRQGDEHHQQTTMDPHQNFGTLLKTMTTLKTLKRSFSWIEGSEERFIRPPLQRQKEQAEVVAGEAISRDRSLEERWRKQIDRDELGRMFDQYIRRDICVH